MNLGLRKNESGYRIIKIGSEDPKAWFHEIAEIHYSELKEGSLRNLGVEGLEIIYSNMVTIPRSGLWCAIEDGRVTGFISGCADIRQFYRELITKTVFPLALKSFSRILKTNSLGNLLKTLLYPFQSSQWIETPGEFHDTNAELIAISVRKEYHHHGIGRKLVEHLEAGFQEWQVDHFYHVATDIRDPLSNAFYLGMGFNKYGVKRFTNFSLQIYEKKIFKQV
jgi:ribosomal protein S18 acetylase RimI-like enzyme